MPIFHQNTLNYRQACLSALLVYYLLILLY